LTPTNPGAPQRDRFILSKGHCAAALYSTLALRGFFPVEELKTFVEPLSPLNGHPNRRKIPGVKANTGPLGHGLPIGVGKTATRYRFHDRAGIGPAIAIGLAEAGAGNALFDLGASRDEKTPPRRSPTGVGRCPKPTCPACTDAISYGARALPIGY